MDNKLLTPELLAPAGSEESLRAALAAGADAVYFGAPSFSNRMRAQNFSLGTIRGAIKLCHDCGAKAHITINTRVRDREIGDVLALAEAILGGDEADRADAIIIADLGIAQEIKRRYPHAVLHASTQTSLASPADCEELKKLGFSRIVLPRELSLDEIREISRRSPIETEIFIHGAHCVSCSGQCLMSYVMGGRSGNRGECAQPCRLSYSISDAVDGRSCKNSGAGTLLSLADMCLAGRIDDILTLGVASLKLEGRLKSPAYVYGVTRIYRRLLDERRRAEPGEIAVLDSLFSRGFTDGYFTRRYSKMAARTAGNDSDRGKIDMSEVSRAIAGRISATRAAKQAAMDEILRTVCAKFVLKSGAAAEFTLIFGDISYTSVGEIPQTATGKPLDIDSAAKNLTKFGGTGFTLPAANIEFTVDDGLWMPTSALNKLRRDAACGLEKMLAECEKRAEVGCAEIGENKLSICDGSNACEAAPHCTDTIAETTDFDGAKSDAGKIAEIADFDRFLSSKKMLTDGEKREFADYFDRIYVPAHQIAAARGYFSESAEICAVLPVFTAALPASGEPCGEHIFDEIRSHGARRVMCHTLGQVAAVRRFGLLPDVSLRANLTNTAACRVYEQLGCMSVTLSPEVPSAAAKSFAKSLSCTVGVTVYGKLPLMTLARCVISGGKCRHGNIGGRISPDKAKPHMCTAGLTDRRGEEFPVIGQADCTNVVYNSVPVWMGDRLDEIQSGADLILQFLFTTEAADEALRIVRMYKSGEKSVGRRI